MALVSVQRSPTPNIFEDEDDSLSTFEDSDRGSMDQVDQGPQASGVHSPRSSEFYFTVKGAAVILSHTDCSLAHHQSSTGDKDLEKHLQLMMRLIRPQDTVSRVVRLQSVADHLVQYLAVVEHRSDHDHRSTALFGFDQIDDVNTSIGLIVPLEHSTIVKLDGDGGIIIENGTDLFFFKPVSIQAMWSIFQYVHKELNAIRSSSAKSVYFWNENYSMHITSNDSIRGLWHLSLLEDAMLGDLKPTGHREALRGGGTPDFDVHTMIRRHLRQIMQSIDLDDVTSADIRKKVEEAVGTSLSQYKEFIDREMLVIMGQLDKPAKICEYLYLGTEWNASNWDELKANKVTFILNMTQEVDNFYPNHFTYKKIWVTDEASTELLMHWQQTYNFIKHAKETGGTVLVHCKKGISRSSSTVIAYIMKEYGWDVSEALNHVKQRRRCITPNEGFMEQLKTFHGMLQASRNRHSHVFNASPTSFEPSPQSALRKHKKKHVDDGLRTLVNVFENCGRHVFVVAQL